MCAVEDMNNVIIKYVCNLKLIMEPSESLFVYFPEQHCPLNEILVSFNCKISFRKSVSSVSLTFLSSETIHF